MIVSNGANSVRLAAQLVVGPVALLAVFLTGCSVSPRAELGDRLADAPDLDGYRLAVSTSDPGIFDCFPAGGTAVLRFDINERRLAVTEASDDDRPALVVDENEVRLRPSAFSSGPDEWWRVDESTPRTSIDRVIGPVVAALGLDSLGDQPTRSAEELVANADTVVRIGDRRYRITDRTSEPTVADLTLDDHGHVNQLAVAADDDERAGSPSTTQARYVARYQDGSGLSEQRMPPVSNIVTATDLDGLDTRPGACGMTVGP